MVPPVRGRYRGAYEAVVANELDKAYEEVPNNEPVIPWDTFKDPVTIALPFTSNFAFGLVVPIPTLPFKAVVIIESFPTVTVFEPSPVASYPITIWFVCASARGLALTPKNIEVLESVWLVVPVPIYRPAYRPKNTLSSPAVR